MEPLKPGDRQVALAAPVADPEGLLAEYERLLAERFTRDPDAPQPLALAPMPDPEDRIAELYAILFPPSAP